MAHPTPDWDPSIVLAHDRFWISMSDGTAHHEKLATGTYFVQARGEGVAHSMHRISVVSDERTRLDVTHVATSAVAFEFVPPPGDANIGLRVKIHDANGASVVDEQFWRFVGTVPFVGSLGLVPGTYHIEARTGSGSLVTRELDIDPAMAQPLRLELR